jgi:glycosyltransferase involved in cell wall biosynthesis
VKVAQLLTRYPPGLGGVERHVAEIAPRLAARGHRVEVFTTDLYSEFPVVRFDARVPREETTSFGAVHRLRVWSLPWDFHYPFFRGLGRAISRYRPDVVHAHTYGTDQVAVARRYLDRTGTPFVLTAHFHPIWSIYGGWLRHRIRSFYDHALAGRLVASAARLIVQTHEEERLLRVLGFPLPPIAIVPPGYTPLPSPPAGPAPFSDAFKIPGPFVLFVGRLASNKGLLELVEAFRTLAAEDRSAHLVLVGEDGGMRAPVMARVRADGLADRVHVVGHVNDDALLAAAYRESRLLALPSEYESFGLVLLEALSHGRPVVASRVGGIPEFIEDGRAGLLVPPKEVPPLASAIVRLWQDASLARQMGEYGRREIVPRYTWDRVVDRIDEIYREVTGS